MSALTGMTSVAMTRGDVIRVILAGDSAGGGLASSLVHYIRDYGKSIGIPQPGHYSIFRIILFRLLYIIF